MFYIQSKFYSGGEGRGGGEGESKGEGPYFCVARFISLFLLMIPPKSWSTSYKTFRNIWFSSIQ